MTDVYLHIGLAKTGTTSIQDALERSAGRLAEHGVLVPGGRHRAHRRAAYDLLGRRIQGDDRAPVAGALRRLVEEIDTHPGPSAVVSEELLALARPRQVRRLTRALGGHRIFVVVGARDLGRTLVSAWQQEVVMGRTFTWREYADAARDPEAANARAGVAFWIRQDLVRVLDAWESQVPRDRIRLLPVPPSGTPSQVLLDRFADAAELPVPLVAAGRPRNTSLGPAEVELVRRLNHRISGPLTRRQYLHVVERSIRPGLTPGSRRLRLPVEDHGWVRARDTDTVGRLRERGYPVYGDLEDLLTPDPGRATGEERGSGDRRLDDVTADELLAAAEAALESLATAHARLFTRHRRALAQEDTGGTGPLERLGSSSRAVGFRARELALERADRSRVLAWAARAYLRRTQG